MPTDDPPLVTAALAGDAGAFEALLDRYQNRVFSFVLRLLGNQQDAEDLAAETFIKAYRRLSSYDPSYPFITWLFRIAHNTVIDFKRRAKAPVIPIDEAETARQFAAVDIPLDRQVGARLAGDVVEKLLAAMPALYREALLLKCKEGLEYKEISGILGVPEGTAKARVSRARDMLKERLKSAGLGDDGN